MKAFRTLAVTVAAGFLFVLTGCGGGGGGGQDPVTDSSQVTPPVDPPVTPPADSTDYTIMSMDQASSVVMSGYALASDIHYLSAGGLWTDASVVPEMTFSADASDVTDVRSLPASFSVTWDVSGVPFSFPTAHVDSIPATSLSMLAASHPVAGTTLTRHASGSQASGVDLCSAVIDASALDVSYTKLAYWKYKKPNTGYFGAPDKILGAHVAGVPTAVNVVENARSGLYSGVMSGVMDSNLASVTYEFGELSAQVQMDYDQVTGRVTLSLNGFKYQQNNCLTTGLGGGQTMGYGFPLFEGVSCIATVDKTNNTFRCSIDDQDNDIQWDVRGRFFGPDAREFAGTVAISGALTTNSGSEGVAAAFSTVRSATP